MVDAHRSCSIDTLQGLPKAGYKLAILLMLIAVMFLIHCRNLLKVLIHHDGDKKARWLFAPFGPKLAQKWYKKAQKIFFSDFSNFIYFLGLFQFFTIYWLFGPKLAPKLTKKAPNCPKYFFFKFFIFYLFLRIFGDFFRFFRPFFDLLSVLDPKWAEKGPKMAKMAQICMTQKPSCLVGCGLS